MHRDRQIFFDQHPDPMWVYDLETLRFLDVNDAAVARYGYGRDEFLAMSIADIRPAEDRPALIQNVQQGTEGLQDAGLWRHKLRSGEIIEVTIRSNGIDFDGRRARLVVARDVTGVVLAERKASALLLLAGQAAQLGGWRYDAAADVVEWSQDAIRLLRIPAGTPPSIRQVGAGLGPRTGARFATLVRRCLDRGEGFSAVFRAQDSAAPARWLRLIGEPERARDGRTVAVTGAVQDVTEVERQRADLRLSEERFRIVAQEADNVVWDYDYLAGTMWCTDNLETIFGHRPDSCTPNLSSWKTRVHPDDLARVQRGLEAALHSDARVWQDEYRYLRANGDIAQVAERGYVMRDSEGRPVRLVGTMQDVTEAREAEMRALRSQRLEALGQLTGGIAHDFNNLLTVILGNAELLTDCRSPEGRQEMAETIIRTAERGAALTGQLLSYARKQPLASRPVNLNGLVAATEDLLRRTLPDTIEIVVRPGADLRPALIDPHQAEAALLNLAINARDAMPDGGRLTIATENCQIGPADADITGNVAPGAYVKLTVRDTGTGMDRTTADRAFEPFFTTKPDGRGSGLGLSMVYGFVRQSGGHIKVSSEPGAGTGFTLWFPCGAGDTELTWDDRPRGTPVGGDAHILVVEDDEQVRAHVVRQLTGLGYRVTEAADGHEALDSFERTAGIDLVFSDVMMPGGIDGPQLARAILQRRPDMKILLTSGYQGEVIDNNDDELGRFPILSKPYRLQELAEQVRRTLAG